MEKKPKNRAESRKVSTKTFKKYESDFQETGYEYGFDERYCKNLRRVGGDGQQGIE